MCFRNTFLVFFILFSCIKVAFLLDNDNIPKTVPSNFNVKTLCEKREKTVKAYAVVPIAVSWFQAFTFCAERNMSLLMIHSKQESDEIRKELLLGKHELKPFYWIAGTRLGAKKTISDFVWFPDGTPFLYTNWFSDKKGHQPDNRNGTEDCVCLSNAGMSNKREYKWHDYKCNKKKAFICESYC
ncbi:L-selectin-like [Anthonomus grandis grandis]|uniref:L-selectin-like n=1 Tax=Anthonomus grandis grandis TaxID=2921223 RepID=UPI0021667334|nr:L-selectin-like [Anthonomus grandis grandis]